MHTDAEDEDMDADDQQNALNKVIEIMTQGECVSLQAAMSQRGFKRIMEQSATIVEARARVQSTRRKFPKVLSKASALLDNMKLQPSVPTEDCDMHFKLLMTSAREDGFERSVSTGCVFE